MYYGRSSFEWRLIGKSEPHMSYCSLHMCQIVAFMSDCRLYVIRPSKVSLISKLLLSPILYSVFSDGWSGGGIFY